MPKYTEIGVVGILTDEAQPYIFFRTNPVTWKNIITIRFTLAVNIQGGLCMFHYPLYTLFI